MRQVLISNGDFGSVPLTLISEGGYSSEYMARSSTREHRLKVRHSKEKAGKGEKALDRHNVELSIRTYATATTPETINQAYIVIRSNPDSDGSDAFDLTMALANLVASYADRIINWESDLSTSNGGSTGDGGEDGDGDPGDPPPLG